jgi:hypothetical protein
MTHARLRHRVPVSSSLNINSRLRLEVPQRSAQSRCGFEAALRYLQATERTRLTSFFISFRCSFHGWLIQVEWFGT